MALGIKATLERNSRLVGESRKLDPAPRIAILYNPSSYEIYRGILVRPRRDMDRRARIQRKALDGFAARNGVLFLDMLPDFRAAAGGEPVGWYYGKTDPVHWSPEGTEVAAKIILEKLKSAL